MSGKRIAWTLAITAGLLLAVVGAGVWVLRSDWLYQKVHRGIVDTVETATGGRVELGKLNFDWRHMRAQVSGFVLHGTEPAGGPPLFHADSVAVGFKIVSILKRDVDIAYLDVAVPRVYLIVGPDGATNVPEPKIHKTAGGPPLQPILDLEIGRFALENGIFEIASRGKTPFDLRGNNLNAKLAYESAGPRYRGNLSMQPLRVQLADYEPVPMGLDMAVTLERDRIGVPSAKVTWGATRVDFSGAVDNLAAPQGAFQYNASVAVREATRVLRIPELHAGTMQLRGNATFTSSAGFAAKGTLHGTGLGYRDSTVHLEEFRADGDMTAGPKGVDVSGLRLNGVYLTDAGRAPLDGRIATATERGRDLEFRGIQMAVFGGSFSGAATVRDLRHYTAKGDITAIEARPVVAMYSSEHLPWNALASGTVEVSGNFEKSRELQASATLSVAPAPDSASVHGQVTATYKALDRTLDLGHSTVTLPASRIDFTGAIPAVLGRPMRVHLETRDLDDLLPAIGENAAELPAKLTGTAIFDGTVTGSLDNPQINGHTRVTGIAAPRMSLDSFEGDAEVSPAKVQLRNATVVHGPTRAQFQMVVSLQQWKTDPSGALSAKGTATNVAISDLAALLDQKDVPITGTAAGSAEVSGTIGDPHASADFTLTRGSVKDEPFDRFTGHLNYTGDLIELTGAQVIAGTRQGSLSATYRHSPGQFDTGRLHAEVRTNAMPVEQFLTLQQEDTGLKGTVQVAAAGDMDIAPTRDGSAPFRVAALQADVVGHGLQLTTQSLGDMHLTASSQGPMLHAHLESNAANTDVRGDGEWRLEGDCPGSATVTFSKLDLAQLRIWLDPSAAGTPAAFSGSAEGQLRIDGPAMRPKSLKAELRIPQFEIAPPPDSGLPAGNLLLHNSGPIVASMANNTITVESAHLVGPSTDLTITGKVLLQRQNALDVRVNGNIDLALLHNLNRDFDSSGKLTTDATLRGSLNDPQLNGRMEFQNAGFSLVGLPNGISKASGVIVFTKDRANIQNFSGETGGGKIELTGFTNLSGGQTVFRLHARATEVRVRYPEGVSTVADANLNLTGESDHSMLSGSVTILRSAFNPQADFSSLLARSAEPVQTPSARTGLVGGMNFDIQINTAPDVQFQSSLTQDIQMEANLRLRGTFSNPAVLGRINITQGRVAFFGTNYNISQGTVSFFNPVRIDPILDIDLETKANGIDVTLNVSGPFNKPNLTPRSDPPLQFNEIVALLANGRPPTSDPTRLAEESTAPQSWQQMGASALLGQAIASPVAGRLQRFFGVSQVRIDPTLPGVEINPQARLTLEQQVTSDITFTYITNVTQSNPQVVRVEWSFAKQWSAVALREENGLFGLDFYFKKRF